VDAISLADMTRVFEAVPQMVPTVICGEVFNGLELFLRVEGPTAQNAVTAARLLTYCARAAAAEMAKDFHAGMLMRANLVMQAQQILAARCERDLYGPLAPSPMGIL
jgi:hypothetical protein